MADSAPPYDPQVKARLWRRRAMPALAALTVSGLAASGYAALTGMASRQPLAVSDWLAVMLGGVLAFTCATWVGWLFWRRLPPCPSAAEVGSLPDASSGKADSASHKVLEQALLRFRMAVEASVDMILLTDAEGFIEYVNPSFTRVTGWAAHEIVGRNTHILASADRPDGVSEAMWKILRRGEFWSGRLLSRRKGKKRPANGQAAQGAEPEASDYWAEVSITPIRGEQGAILGYISIQRDISGLVIEEERLAREREDAETRLRIADILARPDPLRERFGAVLEVLFTLRDLAAKRQGGIFLRRRGADILDIFLLRGEFSEEFAQREREIPLGACWCGNAAASCQLLIRADGACDPRRTGLAKDVSNHGTYVIPLSGNGAALGVMFLHSEPRPSQDPKRVDMLRQVGELMGLAILQAQAAEALQEARDAAFESSRLKSDFLANTSHEIRTPMNGVLGMLELLRATPLTPEQREFAETAHHSAEALLEVINDILDFSKIEAGKLQLESIDFDARLMAEEVCALLARRAHGKGLRLHCFVEPGLPAKLRGDPTRLRQVLTNLIGNAIKFTERGEVSVEAVCAFQDERRATLRFTVRDTGIGIAPEAQARLFQPFIQADRAITRRFGGTGLGLAIVKDLVERMGGEIGVESTLGQGSTFLFTVILDRSPLGQLPAPPRLLAGRRLLAVDDNAINRRILDCYFRDWGAEPALAGSAEEALAKLRSASALGEPYELVILDMHLPDLDGLELSRAMGREPALRGIPRILLSSFGPMNEAEWRAAGVVQVMSKPARQSYLYEAIVAALRAPLPILEAAKPESNGLPNYRGRRVLLVDDDAISRKVAMAMLGRFGLEVTLATDGLEALAALDAARYDLILMDCQMPNLDGLEATRAWRVREAERGLARTRVIALTANAMPSEREDCLAAGMDDHLAKPIVGDALLEGLARWLPG